MRRWIVSAGLVVTTACVGQDPTSSSTSDSLAQISSYQVRGSGAYAYGWGGNSCMWVSFDVQGNDQTSHNTGGRTVTSSLGWAGIWAYDYCTGTEYYGWGSSEGGFSASKSSASAVVTFASGAYRWQIAVAECWQDDAGTWWPCYEYASVGPVDVTINATWTATGDIFRGVDQWVSRWGGYVAKNRWTGSWRDATVSTSVTIAGEDDVTSSAFGAFGTFNSGATEILRQ